MRQAVFSPFLSNPFEIVGGSRKIAYCQCGANFPGSTTSFHVPPPQICNIILRSCKPASKASLSSDTEKTGLEWRNGNLHRTSELSSSFAFLVESIIYQLSIGQISLYMFRKDIDCLFFHAFLTGFTQGVPLIKVTLIS